MGTNNCDYLIITNSYVMKLTIVHINNCDFKLIVLVIKNNLKVLWKNLIDWNWLKKFMQVGIDVTCMHTNFDGRGSSGFGDTTTLKNDQISLSTHGL